MKNRPITEGYLRKGGINPIGSFNKRPPPPVPLNKERKKENNMGNNFLPTTKRNVDIKGADFYPTPKWATYALMENEKFDGDIWEPSCGNGAMSEVIKKYGNDVYSSDLHDRGYGDVGINFLETEKTYSNIITNPPYNIAQEFVEHATKSSKRKFAFLLRLAFLEGVGGANTIFVENPPSRVWVFSERITFYPEGVIKAGSGTTAYAWFVWDKEHISNTHLKWLKPGYKKLYG